MSTSPKRINLNADMGESFGRYQLGADEALIRYVDTVNVACGYHAADPGRMLRSVMLSKRFGVELGAHIAYRDLMGFGRRRMSLSEEEMFGTSRRRGASCAPSERWDPAWRSSWRGRWSPRSAHARAFR
jgi:hypothetical protein